MAMNPRLLVPRASYDPDAAVYLAAVEAADGQALETPVKRAIDTFFGALKATPGLFDAIKASCILCGARTITGALVPLAGPAPTAQGGWASGDYSRTAGLTGDENALYLDTNRANNADPEDDNHQSVYISSADTRYADGVGVRYIGASNAASTSRSTIGTFSDELYVNNMSGSQAISGAPANATGLIGSSRQSSSEYAVRSGGIDYQKSVASVAPEVKNHLVFCENTSGGSPGAFTNATIAFYSIGTSVDLEALDTAVSNLISDIGAAL